jgi:hypothetical protein
MRTYIHTGRVQSRRFNFEGVAASEWEKFIKAARKSAGVSKDDSSTAICMRFSSSVEGVSGVYLNAMQLLQLTRMDAMHRYPVAAIQALVGAKCGQNVRWSQRKGIVYKCAYKKDSVAGCSIRHTKEYDVCEIPWDTHMSSTRPREVVLQPQLQEPLLQRLASPMGNVRGSSHSVLSDLSKGGSWISRSKKSLVSARAAGSMTAKNDAHKHTHNSANDAGADADADGDVQANTHANSNHTQSEDNNTEASNNTGAHNHAAKRPSSALPKRGRPPALNTDADTNNTKLEEAPMSTVTGTRTRSGSRDNRSTGGSVRPVSPSANKPDHNSDVDPNNRGMGQGKAHDNRNTRTSKSSHLRDRSPGSVLDSSTNIKTQSLDISGGRYLGAEAVVSREAPCELEDDLGGRGTPSWQVKKQTLINIGSNRDQLADLSVRVVRYAERSRGVMVCVCVCVYVCVFMTVCACLCVCTYVYTSLDDHNCVLVVCEEKLRGVMVCVYVCVCL